MPALDLALEDLGPAALADRGIAMIDRLEIIETATRMSLGPQVVEKDYVLGWVLAGIYAHPDLAKTWVFKGGTCLKKCFFETYRFSEDLDFTLTDASHLDKRFLQKTFAEVVEWVYEHSGIEMPADQPAFDIYTNPRGSTSCQGKLSYRGPVSPRSGGWPRIKLDLTADERLVLAPVSAPVFHPYSDEPEGGIQALAYAYEEVFGEKVRALAERTRPRDLYDVINLFRNDNARPSPAVMLDVLRQKCEFKSISLPNMADLEPHRAELVGGWHNMLAHQLPALPSVDAFWDELPAFFEWLVGDVSLVVPAAFPSAVGEMVLRNRVLELPVSGAVQAYVEIIRFAAANHLCVDLDYRKLDGTRSQPRIEAYSLRRTADGNIVLHGYDVNKHGHRSYRVDQIGGARVSNQTFIPRYEIELSPKGPLHVARTAPRATGAGRLSRMSRPASPRTIVWRSSGPTYVYQCPVCQKKFQRKAQTSKLNLHKSRSGYPCSGRHGMFIETRY
jgi:predicted nucleotidyltransferase component of viral defense system